MRVWILQTGEPLQIDSNGLRPMRAMNLSKALVDQGHQVTLWSSDFDHFSKQHRYGSEQAIAFSDQLTIRLIKSCGYDSHVGLRRLLDHAQLGWNLSKKLKREEAPDIAFIGYPPIEPALVLSLWLKRKNIKYMVDVKDAWPNILLRGIPKKLKLFGILALTPYFLAMRCIFRNATSISSITQPYLDWCNHSARRVVSEFDRVTPLTSQVLTHSLSEIDIATFELKKIGVRDDELFKVAFIGTLNSAFDFLPIIEAARCLKFLLIIAGDGPQLQELKEKCISDENIVFTGWINSATASVLMRMSSIMLAPLRDLPDFKMSMPNKFYDAMQNSKAILTSISGYAGNFVSNEKIGVEYSNEDIEGLKLELSRLMQNPAILEEMGKNASKVYASQFEFNKTYEALVTDLETIARKGLV
jgi:glycosyltransferase involved in cell wall biosynthesis